MSRSIKEIIKQWQTKTKIKKELPPSRPKLKKMVNDFPNSIQAKLNMNPYAMILASPVRLCTFHRHLFPSKLLIRFGIAWHPETKKNWAYPTLTKTGGLGYYVKLNKRVLEAFQKSGHQFAFRGRAVYRSDMVEHVQRLLFKELLDQFEKCPKRTIHILKMVQGSLSSTESSTMRYQCVLQLDPNENAQMSDDHFIQLSSQRIPYYNMRQFWSQEEINSVKSRLGLALDKSICLGVVEDVDTVDLAITLWRCRAFIS